MATQILVPLDGSRFAEQALSCAMGLGQRLPAELILFRAVSPPRSAKQVTASVGTEAGDLVTKANDYLQGVVHSLRETNPDARYVVRHGPAAKAIADYAGQMKVQQIIMATHGYSGLKRWLHGSVAEGVLQSATSPVLLVRGCGQDSTDARRPISCCRVLVPLDGSDRAEQVLPWAASLSRAMGCEMILFQVSMAFLFEFSSRAADRMANAYLEDVAGRPEHQGIDISTAVRTGPIAETIVQFVEANHIDLIAMCTHGRTGIARWALGSVADRVFHTSHVPLLLVRARQQRGTIPIPRHSLN